MTSVEQGLSGQVAIVTGAGQGVGRGVSIALAKRGVHIAAIGRTESTLDETIAIVSSSGGSARRFVCDVGDRARVDAAVESVVAAFGRVDILVNNAQTFNRKPLEHTTDSDLDVAYRSGPLGALYMMQACFPHLCHRGGSVVNFGTAAAIMGVPGLGSYAMAKEAVRALTRVAAKEWGPYGVRVNTVCPLAESPLSAAHARDNPAWMAALISSIPLGRNGDAEIDIGNAIAALVSPDMHYLTAATIMLDGGRVLVA